MKFYDSSNALKLVKQLYDKTCSIISREDKIIYTQAIEDLEDYINHSESALLNVDKDMQKKHTKK